MPAAGDAGAPTCTLPLWLLAAATGATTLSCACPATSGLAAAASGARVAVKADVPVTKMLLPDAKALKSPVVRLAARLVATVASVGVPLAL